MPLMLRRLEAQVRPHPMDGSLRDSLPRPRRPQPDSVPVHANEHP